MGRHWDSMELSSRIFRPRLIYLCPLAGLESLPCKIGESGRSTPLRSGIKSSTKMPLAVINMHVSVWYWERFWRVGGKKCARHSHEVKEFISKAKWKMKYDLTLPLLRLLLSKAQDFWKPSKPSHVGIHWKALVEYSQMSTHVAGLQWSFSCFCIILYWPN